MTHDEKLKIKREREQLLGEKEKRSTRIKKFTGEKFLLGVHELYDIALRSYGLFVAFSPPEPKI